MALPIFMITLFISAFLLFLVQPMIGKMILPKLGGTPQVWNTCMVFFQATLLAGYAYTHTTSTRLPTRRQLLIHGVLLFLPFLILLPNGPFNIINWTPDLGVNPIFSTLALLLVIVGLPFLVVSTSAPLLQRWFAQTGHPASKDPYFLYAASNVGSLAGLVLYPALIEWVLPLRGQAWFWTGGYAVFLGCILVCAFYVWKTAPQAKLVTADGEPEKPPEAEEKAATEEKPEPKAVESSTAVTATAPTGQRRRRRKKKRGKDAESAGDTTDKPRKSIVKHDSPVFSPSDKDLTWQRRLRWVILGAIPSSLMLGVTTYVTTDLSPIPLFWIVPLMLYLISFILVFAKWPVVWTGAPHTAMLYAQPFAIFLMVLFNIMQVGVGAHGLGAPVLFNVLGFFLTAMVCHGELARDRPGTKHLTEFFLWMSVGGVTGGIFNGLLAPILFLRNWEYPVAIVVACLMRPRMTEADWADQAVLGFMDPKAQSSAAKKGGARRKDAETIIKKDYQNLPNILDYVLPVVLVVLWAFFWFTGGLFGSADMRQLFGFGLPLLLSCAFLMRPIRFGLAVGVLMLIHTIMAFANEPDTIYSARSYFGIIRVNERQRYIKDDSGDSILQTFRGLTHGQTDHGMNFRKPPKKEQWNKANSDFTRLATTYYHRRCPVGMAMKKFDWWRNDSSAGQKDPITLGELNTFNADARLPVSVIGSGAMPFAGLPLDPIVSAWSEPPFATVGLGTGTMASYGRCYQHVHFYEIDNVIRRLSLPRRVEGEHLTYYGPDIRKALKNEKIFFNYLLYAAKRGSYVQVLMGDARTRMALPYSPYSEKEEIAGISKSGGGDNFYHLMAVDAFSSDAIPVHLLTKQALEMYFTKLVPNGILCLHTSNKYVNLVKVIAAVCDDLYLKDEITGKPTPLVCKRGHDPAPEGKDHLNNRDGIGHYTSEWVMVARNGTDLSYLQPPTGYMDLLIRASKGGRYTDPELFIKSNEQFWADPLREAGMSVWTDDFSNLVSALRLWER